MIKYDTGYFIKNANIKHNYKFDYSKVNYINSKSKIIIVCKIHGEFYQTPSDHLSGRGCPCCGGRRKLTKEEFIEKANKKHNNVYDYNNVFYINIKIPVCIICNLHGEFYQTPDNHLYGDNRISGGNGCPSCKNTFKLTTEEFIHRANLKHNNKYLYDRTIYISNKKKIEIYCKIHGYFKQTPNNHLSGNGCQSCNKSKGELVIENYLNKNNIKYNTQHYFRDLKYRKYLKFDFAIIDDVKNIQYLIEYNGIQHYEYREKLQKTEEEFFAGKKRDQLKIDYCKNNNIKLHIIKYDEDIEECMKKIINNYEKENS